ncbi:MAG: SAM-dependent methyltransferase [Gammaproteobacteria bacterium]|nr:SAM-dependent methyltransferase [Gammaproteobacteria bacterium]
MSLVSNFLELPEPSADERAYSQRLAALIDRDIQSHGGRITFARFMQMALYTQDMGYYTGPSEIFGDGGDFVTAPELSSLFGRCVARQAQQVLQQIGGGDMLEFGAGSGKLALDVLTELEKLNCLPQHYYIVDISHRLRDRQRQRLLSAMPYMVDRVHWLDRMPDNFSGFVFGNEVPDAMPVHRVRFYHDRPHTELYVTENNGQFDWLEAEPSSDELRSAIDEVFAQYRGQISDGYTSEINLQMRPWLRELASKIKKGAIVLVDYGYVRREFFQAERFEGTLMAHFKHRAHSFVLAWPGLQDLTAHVEFTAVADAAFDAGLDVLGFTNQAGFLSGCGLESMLQEVDPADTKKFISFIQPIKRLIMPTEMGELFKVIALTKEIDPPLIGFTIMDQRDRL